MTLFCQSGSLLELQPAESDVGVLHWLVRAAVVPAWHRPPARRSGAQAPAGRAGQPMQYFIHFRSANFNLEFRTTTLLFGLQVRGMGVLYCHAMEVNSLGRYGTRARGLGNIL